MRRPLEERLRLEVVHDEPHHRLVLARQGGQLGDEERVRQEADVEHDVGLGGDAVLEPERQHRHRQLALTAPVALLDQAPQHVDVQRAGVDDRARLLAQSRQRLPLGADAGADVRVRQRVPAPRLGEPPQEDLVRRFEKKHLDGMPAFAQVR